MTACQEHGHAPDRPRRDLDREVRRLAEVARLAAERHRAQRRRRRATLARLGDPGACLHSAAGRRARLPRKRDPRRPGRRAHLHLAGIEVNVFGFTIRDAASEVQMDSGSPLLAVRGEVVNVADSPRQVPTLRFVLRDGEGRETYAWTLDGVGARTARARRGDELPHPRSRAAGACQGRRDSLCPRATDPLKPGMKAVTIDGHRVEVLFSESEIAARVQAIADAVAKLKPERLLVVPILKGSFVFAADLLRAFYRSGLRPEVDFMMLASYRQATVSSGQIEVLRDIETDVRGRDVLLIDDILESGRTLAYAKDLLAARGALRTMTAVLLDKAGHRAAEIEADFKGFDCPDKFVIGYGMDMAHAFRELPFVGYFSGD
jgi:hypoxanthine phosphoribosyltransferase